MQNDKQRVIRDKTLPRSIRSVVRMYPSNQVNRLSHGGLPHIGNALWGAWSSHETQEAAEAYEHYSLSLNLLIKGFKRPTVGKVRLGGGSPARFKPFKGSISGMKNALKERILSDYPLAAGDGADKKSIIEYFNNAHSLKIKPDNIIFAHSSTQAFTLVMGAILDFGDVVLMTAPNYGLFSFIPERVGGRVRLLPLVPADGWKVNPRKLASLIANINNELQKDYDVNRGKYVFRRSDIPPRVAAFVNLNPHNPTGVVYGKKDRLLLLAIADICKEAGVFVIDDLAYAGLEYDRSNLALPVCSLKGHFKNTITLYSLSKSYGLAGIRSGLVIADEVISSLVRDNIFQASDSLYLLQSSAMSAVFPLDKKQERERERYFASITKKYRERYIFVKAIVLGIHRLRREELILLNKVIKNNGVAINIAKMMTGIRDVDIVLDPESGFFALLDLSRILGKTYKGFKIVDDKTLLQFLYTSGNIKVLTGKAFFWANRSQLVARTTVALGYEDLLIGFLRLKRSIESLS